MEIIKRLFLAVLLSESDKRQIEKLQEEIARSFKLSFDSFIPVDNLHVTLHFFGPVPEIEILKLQSKVKEFSRLNSFSFQFNQILAFPENKTPRVIALAGPQGSSPLSYLYSKLKLGLQELNFQTEERPFIPHITLFRLKNNTQAFGSYPLEPVSIRVQEFALFESVLNRDGSCYRILEKYPLR